MKHKHAELIKAWADGKLEVEYRYPKHDGSWSLWKDLTQCVFHDWYEYRIKPEVTQSNTQLHPLTDEEKKKIAKQLWRFGWVDCICLLDEIEILRKAQEK